MENFNSTYGQLSYRFDKRSEKIVLLFNGTFTNVEMKDTEQYFIDRNFSVLSVGRPGYNKTSVKLSYVEGQFEKSVAELLSALQIKSIIVLGISVGGRSAMRFAALYPDRTKVLLLFSTASFSNWQNRIGGLASKILFGTAIGGLCWSIIHLIIRIAPLRGTAFVFSSTTKKDALTVLKSYPEARLDQLRHMLLECRAPKGVMVDVSHENERGDPSTIIVPTYIFHSRYDAAVPLQHPQVLAGQIKNSQLFINDTDSHLMWFSDEWRKVEDQLDQILA